LVSNGFQSAAIVMAILAIFLKSASRLLSDGHISFLGSLPVLPAIGVSVSHGFLFAFLVVLGIVVDDAIVSARTSTSMAGGLDFMSAAIKAPARSPRRSSAHRHDHRRLRAPAVTRHHRQFWWPLPAVVIS
jgi:multidrug efflux pump subunit AcrB